MSHLTYDNRVQLQTLLYDACYKQYQIANIIWCSSPTISNELRRFKQRWIAYDYKLAHEIKIIKRSEANKKVHTREIKWSYLETYILTHINQYRSPEQIAWSRSKENVIESISHTTIYKFVKKEYPELIKKYFRRKWKKYKHSSASASKIPNRISIEERPVEVQTKQTIWHFEWNTIVWSNKSDCIVTLLERKSWFFMARIVKLLPWECLSVAVSTFITEMMWTIPAFARKTLTLDNWTEFADHEYVTDMLGTLVYFANPYHSRERWANENANWLLRQFLPKGLSFIQVTQDELDYYVHLINMRPRKRLWWNNPIDVFDREKN